MSVHQSLWPPSLTPATSAMKIPQNTEEDPEEAADGDNQMEYSSH